MVWEFSLVRITFLGKAICSELLMIIWALYYKDEGPKRKKYSWELEEDVLKSLDGIEVYYEDVPIIYTDKRSIELKYEYKQKT
ncbi:MAG: hypothetical protein CM15mP23_10080 [Cryomorphaceae bacterium]|nr:MAG: hypothetical protein CM15mP23_10080 [Cryomorphaceae bacterium]